MLYILLDKIQKKSAAALSELQSLTSMLLVTLHFGESNQDSKLLRLLGGRNSVSPGNSTETASNDFLAVFGNGLYF